MLYDWMYALNVFGLSLELFRQLVVLQTQPVHLELALGSSCSLIGSLPF